MADEPLLEDDDVTVLEARIETAGVRLDKALTFRKTPEPARFAELVKKRDELLALA